jgi:hypothetical protein
MIYNSQVIHTHWAVVVICRARLLVIKHRDLHVLAVINNECIRSLGEEGAGGASSHERILRRRRRCDVRVESVVAVIMFTGR